MRIEYQPKNDLEIFGQKVLNTLADKFPKTYFVGGLVRDMLLGREIQDVDIATSATPEQIAETLGGEFEIDSRDKNFAVVRAGSTGLAAAADKWIQITTFRTETYVGSRYPKVSFTASPGADSRRRDFTINSLYMDWRGEILDFQNGLADLKSKTIKFIGDPETRLVEDLVRLARAIRFALQLNFLLDAATAQAVQKNFSLVETIKPKHMAEEIKKLAPEMQKKFQIIINSRVLDVSLVNSYNDGV